MTRLFVDRAGRIADTSNTGPIAKNGETERELSMLVRHRRMERRRSADYVGRPEARL